MALSRCLRTISIPLILTALTSCGGPSSTSGPSSGSEVSLLKINVDSSVIGGRAAHGTVTLTAAAPADGFALTLSADSAAATVPSTIAVPAGATTAAFDIATTRVTTATVVTINAQAGGVRRTTALRLQIDPAGLTPTTGYTVGFSALRENKAAFTTHVESGFTVSAVAGDWMAITTYGNPQPFVEFYAPAGTTGTGEIRITAGGAPFWLNSVDFYSSTTKIPYVIDGFFNSEQVFSVVDVIGNTFGAFARRSNPNASTVVDELRIRLSNPSAPCCTNPMGLDNIVLSR